MQRRVVPEGVRARDSMQKAGATTKKNSTQADPAKRFSLARTTKGEVHKLYMRFSKDQEGRSLIKQQLMSLMKAMTKQGKFRISSEQRLKQFVEEQFKKYDYDGNDSLSLEEFMDFYAAWLDTTSCELLQKHTKTTNEVESIFMKYDKNHDFKLTTKELTTLMLERTPHGLNKPTDEQLGEIIAWIMEKFDKKVVDEALQFEEFAEAYNEIVAKLDEIFAKQRKDILETTGFRGLMKRHDSKDALIEATKDRYERPVWVVPYKETCKALQKAMEAEERKVPLFLDAPPGELDFATSELQSRGEPVVQMQELVMQFARKNLTAEDVCDKICEQLADAMNAGRKVVLRMGQSTPDWLVSLDLPKHLPAADFVLDASHHKPGPVPEAFSDVFRKYCCTDINEGFAVVLTSCFTMDNYKTYFNAKLPFKKIQPIQVMQTLEEVSAVLVDGLPKEGMDEALTELDRLGDML